MPGGEGETNMPGLEHDGLDQDHIPVVPNVSLELVNEGSCQRQRNPLAGPEKEVSTPRSEKPRTPGARSPAMSVKVTRHSSSGAQQLVEAHKDLVVPTTPPRVLQSREATPRAGRGRSPRMAEMGPGRGGEDSLSPEGRWIVSSVLSTGSATARPATSGSTRLVGSLNLKTLSRHPWENLTLSVLTPRVGASRSGIQPISAEQCSAERLYLGRVAGRAGGGHYHVQCEELQGGHVLMSSSMMRGRSARDALGCAVSFKLQAAPNESKASRAEAGMGRAYPKLHFSIGTVVTQANLLHGKFAQVESDEGPCLWLNIERKKKGCLKAGFCGDMLDAYVAPLKSPLKNHVVAHLSGSGVAVLVDVSCFPSLASDLDRIAGQQERRSPIPVRCRVVGVVGADQTALVTPNDVLVDGPGARDGTACVLVCGMWETHGLVRMFTTGGAFEFIVDFREADTEVIVGVWVLVRFEMAEASLGHASTLGLRGRRAHVGGLCAVEGRVAFLTHVVQMLETKSYHGSERAMLPPKHCTRATFLRLQEMDGSTWAHVQVEAAEVLAHVTGRMCSSLRPGCSVAVCHSLVHRLETQSDTPGRTRWLRLDTGPGEEGHVQSGHSGGDHRLNRTATGMGLTWHAREEDEPEPSPAIEGLSSGSRGGSRGRSGSPLRVLGGGQRVACDVAVLPDWVLGENGSLPTHFGVVVAWLPRYGKGRALSYQSGREVLLQACNLLQGVDPACLCVGVRVSFKVLMDSLGSLQAVQVSLCAAQDEFGGRRPGSAKATLPWTATYALSLMPKNPRWASSTWDAESVATTGIGSRASSLRRSMPMPKVGSLTARDPIRPHTSQSIAPIARRAQARIEARISV